MQGNSSNISRIQATIVAYPTITAPNWVVADNFGLWYRVSVPGTRHQGEIWSFVLVGVLAYSSQWRLFMSLDGTSNKYGDKVGRLTLMPSDFLDNQYLYSEHQYRRIV